MITIAIDGPAGAGKSSAAKRLAQELSISYLDTGAMYRALGLKALRLGFAPSDEEKVVPMMAGTSLDVQYSEGRQRVLLDGEDVSGLIRSNEVSRAASDISVIAEVRAQMVKLQQKIAQGKSVVMDGRDIGTVVLPQADFKFFVTASPRERAKRRFLELAQRGIHDKSLEELEREIVERDYQDTHRAHAPLRMAEDGILVDTSEMTLEEAVEFMIRQIQAR